MMMMESPSPQSQQDCLTFYAVARIMRKWASLGASSSSSTSNCYKSKSGISVSSSRRRRKRESSLMIIVLIAISSSIFWPCVQSKFFVDDSNSEEVFPLGRRHALGNWTEVGISPPVLNLATKADIEVNSTCGEREPETYCKLVEHAYSSRNGVRSRSSQCQVCDATSSDKGKRHPIRYTIDGSNRWWQSATLQNGRQYEWVTITIDLKQIYQVAYIIIKAAISPRPGNWILERSLDGYVYLPWQYYATSDEECWNRYRIRAKPGKPSYVDDEEVICTSYYSSITPFEGGEIHTSLVNGRPGADGPSEALTRFTMARYVRLRLQKIRTLHGDLMNVGGPESRSLDKSVLRRYFYSIKDISIGGHCVCFGHANECVMDSQSQSEKCMCQHNTCGDRCDICCPLYNQHPWGPGNSTDSARCEKCQCYGHAESCVYDKIIHEQSQSVNIFGDMDGGGVCLDCKHHTTGINCERCVEGFYRPRGVLENDSNPCVKCDCDPIGSMGQCIGSEDEGFKRGKNPGDCICKDGYEGRRCDKCSIGFKGFPHCAPCPCHISGIVNTDCEGDLCRCKENVEGRHCSECKKGYFNLLQENPDGCTECFCHGVTNDCTQSHFPIMQITDGHNWFVTDLHGTKTIPAVEMGDNNLHQIGNEEFASFAEYFWVSNSRHFAGNKIHSYGLSVRFHVSWVQARGDTSGRPIPDYDLIIQSTNSMLGFSYGLHEGDNVTVNAVLSEINCVVLPDVDNHIVQRSPIPKKGTPCTRYDIMEALSDVKRLLLRAKYHTDQIEGMLHHVILEGADMNSTALPNSPIATSIEMCVCPKGYTGSSCELCDYGFRKLKKDSWLNECVKCDCNGHSSSCDFEGNCLTCDHNTTGDQCDLCKQGFYGDPSKSEDKSSCKPCECPLGIPSNNFSPTCKLISSVNSGHECDACPVGYEGPYCERCANGFYGHPTQPGDYCKPCQCSTTSSSSSPSGNELANTLQSSSSDNICDHLTGECLVCARNTVGWNCDECILGFYGNPLNGTCVPCDCDQIGSISGKGSTCHIDNGQCPCKENFGGRRCDACMEGHGNTLEGCPQCGCNHLGSLSLTCDQVSGQCKCKPGVGGRYCNKCVDNHFGFSSGGCSICECNQLGCDSDLCDLNTGQCHCLPHVTGRKCEECEVGWWNLRSGKGCERCSCDPLGSFGHTCDRETGQCVCKPGVGGRDCSKCFEGHYGLAHVGCKVCDPCDKPGHVCDPNSGRCVCPPNTEGETCEKCTVGYWGRREDGCQPCNCSQQGAVQPQCHPETGKCVCQFGFEGDKCKQCRFGHFNYPLCTPCGCDPAGTLEEHCRLNGTCSCSSGGQCPCKENVLGTKCDRCKPGFYGFEEDNPEGCMQCFCFQRTNKCSQGYFKWQRFAMPIDRQNSLNLATLSQLTGMNGLFVIPDTARDVIIEKDISFGYPLYWQLPHIFLGDKVLSYNGYLRFHTHSIAGVPHFPGHVLASYPLIQVQGNHRLILEHFPAEPYKSGFYEVKLHEDDWRLKNGPYNGVVSKEVMMVALQNLQHIFIRATYAPEVYNASLFNVSLDIAIPSPNGDKTMAHGIEVCDCPPEYNSTSCQNPRIGFYRWYKRDYITSTVIIDLVGEARRCDCNGRATSCDTESGSCQNCRDNTSGPRCDVCAEGYYGNPNYRCLPCPCPSIWNNHAKSCYKYPYTAQFQCSCKSGYTGENCSRCDYGYYGNPFDTGGHCTPCNCNAYGSVSDECHEITGQCNCQVGVTGRDCTNCADRHVFIGQRCTSCEDQCTGVLLRDLDKMGEVLKQGDNIDPEQILVWKKMVNVDETSKEALVKVNNALAISMFVEDLPRHENLCNMMEFRMMELRRECDKLLGDSYMIVEKGKLAEEGVKMVKEEMGGVMTFLKDYADGKIIPQVETDWAQKEAGDVISMLESAGLELQETTRRAEDELTEINNLWDVMMGRIFNETVAGEQLTQMEDLRGKLEDVGEWITHAEKATDEAIRVMITAKEFLDNLRVNVDAIEEMTLNMDMKAVMTVTTLGEGGYLRTELEQVLFMLEDILRDFRNTTKDLEIRDNFLFETVPLFRVLYAQPAFDHELELIIRGKYIESLFGSARLNGSESIQAVTAFDRMKHGFLLAHELALNATKVATRSGTKIQEILSQHSSAILLESSSGLVDAGLVLSGTIENALRRNLSTCKSDIDSLTWNVKVANESLRHMNSDVDNILETEMKLPELIDRIEEIKDTVGETTMAVMETESKVHNEIKSRLDGIRGGAPFDAVDAAIQVTRAKHNIPPVTTQTNLMERKQQILSGKRENLEEKMKYLRALIQQSKHKANTVGVSLGPDETGTCFRVYNWPSIDSATSIVFHFAPTRTDDSLLFYWPSSINEDFIAIEMINLHIKASWDLGSGLRTLIHQRKLGELSLNSDDPDHWFEITFERIGSSATLDVKPVSIDPSVPTSSYRSTPVKYVNSDEEATLFNLSPNDLLHIGGMSREMRAGLVDNGLSGCIHNLRVNRKSLGLWNFARTEGCQPCVECQDLSSDLPSGDLEYYFDGRGYSVIKRIQSQTFNSRIFDVSLEFRTYSENGLLFLTVNDTVGQIISLELKEGRVIMQVRHKWDDLKESIRVESEPSGRKYNTGDWVDVRAVWIYQRGTNTQTAKIILGKKDFTQEKRTTSSLSLKLYEASYQIGGVAPTFDPTKWDALLGEIVPFVGCMKSILVDGSTYDPMAGHYFGVESPCSGRSIYLTSFEGDGWAEFGSKIIGKNFKLGFSFKTVEPTGLLLLSTFARAPEAPDGHYYAVYLDQGKVQIQIGVAQGPFELSSGNGTRYDDGKFHSIRFFKKNRKMYLYVDDDELMEIRLPKQTPVINAPRGRGLFVGGTTPQIQAKFQREEPLPVQRGFKGCIQNLYFENDLIDFNYPVSYSNQNLGQCPKHHDPDPLFLNTNYLYLNTMESSSASRHEAIIRMSDPECAPHTNPVIEQEEPFKAWQFGDAKNSYATLNLVGSKVLKQTFNVTFHFRSLYPNGMFFQGLRKRGGGGNNGGGYCLMSFLKDGQVIVKLHGSRPQDLVSPVSGLNDGKWHQISLVKADDKMYLYIDSRNATVTQVPKIRAIGKMHIGGVPEDGHDCLENSIHKPEYFKGCLKNFIINSHVYNLDSNSAHLSNVNPCFRSAESGTFFRMGSYAIYSHNLTLGNMLEVQLEFRSDSRNGILLSLLPNKSSKYPKFTIFLKDGKVIARETLGVDEHYEAISDFEPDKGYVCDGHWHKVRANYERGSITLRVDNRPTLHALEEPNLLNPSRLSLFPDSSQLGTMYIGGLEDGASRSSSKLQFHGCIRNIIVNREIRDWTDMALIHNLYLNSCPL